MPVYFLKFDNMSKYEHTLRVKMHRPRKQNKNYNVTLVFHII